MKANNPKKIIRFSDGILKLYSPNSDNAKAEFCFSEYKLGVTRFYAALSAGVKISRVVRILQSHIFPDGTETVKIGEREYVIAQIQKDDESVPKTLILTLSEAE